ncbi:MAG: hypothetical protein ACTSO9_16605 [Candidatus Helarchaeota archaeon]
MKKHSYFLTYNSFTEVQNNPTLREQLPNNFKRYYNFIGTLYDYVVNTIEYRKNLAEVNLDNNNDIFQLHNYRQVAIQIKAEVILDNSNDIFHFYTSKFRFFKDFLKQIIKIFQDLLDLQLIFINELFLIFHGLFRLLNQDHGSLILSLQFLANSEDHLVLLYIFSFIFEKAIKKSLIPIKKYLRKNGFRKNFMLFNREIFRVFNIKKHNFIDKFFQRWRGHHESDVSSTYFRLKELLKQKKKSIYFITWSL